MAAFELSKWYLDYVTESGDAAIAYVGAVRWGALRLHFSSLLQSAGRDVTQRNSLRRPSLPAVSGERVSWSSEPLGFSASWRADSTPLRETIFASDEGEVEWRCLIPCGRIEGAGAGFGYVERLTMTLAPWRIPIRELRWGRFCSASDWIVWIDWTGSYSTRIAYRNGQAVRPARLGESEIVLEDGARLSMDRSLVLRVGPLGTTALSSIPGVGRTFPARLLQVHESKWRSRARLEHPGRPPVDGWAIHEVVRWPR